MARELLEKPPRRVAFFVLCTSREKGKYTEPSQVRARVAVMVGGARRETIAKRLATGAKGRRQIGEVEGGSGALGKRHATTDLT
jgi:hypothetical protein